MAKKPTNSNFFRDIVEDIKDEFTSIAADGISSAEFTGYVDTGSYMLNALVSGTIFGGIPNNKVAAIAGETTTGKTFFALGVVKHFLDANPTGGVLYFDTEAAITNEMMTERGIDTSRVIISEPITIEAFRTKCVGFLDKYAAHPEKSRPPLMIILDSLGALSNENEIASASGEIKADVGRQAKLIKGAFRVLRLKLAALKVPMIVTNHVYEKIGSYVPTKEQSGGSGLKFTSDLILELSKKKDRDGKDVVGNLITVKNWKNRMAKQDARVELRLSFVTGLDRYYGLLDLGEAYGIFKKVSTRYEMPDGTKAFAKEIYSHPDKYFTPDILKQLDEAAGKEFKYGGEVVAMDDDVEETEDDEAA
jgi:RecA/RadA recombinase